MQIICQGSKLYGKSACSVIALIVASLYLYRDSDLLDCIVSFNLLNKTYLCMMLHSNPYYIGYVGTNTSEQWAYNAEHQLNA